MEAIGPDYIMDDAFHPEGCTPDVQFPETESLPTINITNVPPPVEAISTILEKIKIFVEATLATAGARQKLQLYGVSKIIYPHCIAWLESHGIKKKIEYDSRLALLTITLDNGILHETLTGYAPYTRTSLLDQGFIASSWPSGPQFIEMSGSMEIKYEYEGYTRRVQSDAGLRFSNVPLPFLIIEIADTQSYRDAYYKCKHLLLHSQGDVRFAIIVDLERKPRRRINAGEEEVKAGNARTVKGSGKRNLDAPEPINKRARAGDPGSSSSLSQRGPENDNVEVEEYSLPITDAEVIHPIYIRGRVAVLTTRFRINANQADKPTVIELVELLPPTEFWPQPTTETVKFSWDDMNLEYPDEMRGRKFTLEFSWLTQAVARHVHPPQGLPKRMVPRGQVVIPRSSFDEEEEEEEEEEQEEEQEEEEQEANARTNEVERDNVYKGRNLKQFETHSRGNVTTRSACRQQEPGHTDTRATGP